MDQVIRLTKAGKPDRRVLRRERHLQALVKFIAKPRTVQECADNLGVHIRAVYLLFTELSARGMPVARIGPKSNARFRLLN